MSEPKSIICTRPEDGAKKHSVRFNAPVEPGAILTSIYVSNDMPGIKTAKKIRVTVEVIE